jgi:hypothetical protein
MRTRQRLRAVIRQPAQPLDRVPAQPSVHRLTGDPEPAGYIGDRRAVVEHTSNTA